MSAIKRNRHKKSEGSHQENEAEKEKKQRVNETATKRFCEQPWLNPEN